MRWDSKNSRASAKQVIEGAKKSRDPAIRKLAKSGGKKDAQAILDADLACSKRPTRKATIVARALLKLSDFLAPKHEPPANAVEVLMRMAGRERDSAAKATTAAERTYHLEDARHYEARAKALKTKRAAAKKATKKVAKKVAKKTAKKVPRKRK